MRMSDAVDGPEWAKADGQRMPLVVFEFDGTFLRPKRDAYVIDVADAESLRDSLEAHEPACRLLAMSHVQTLPMGRKSGVRAVYLVWRPARMAEVTAQQMHDAGLPTMPAFHVDVVDDVPNQENEAATKAAMMSVIEGMLGKPALYVGDKAADEEAARLAGVPFLYAEGWRDFAVRTNGLVALPVEAFDHGAAAILLLMQRASDNDRRFPPDEMKVALPGSHCLTQGYCGGLWCACACIGCKAAKAKGERPA